MASRPMPRLDAMSSVLLNCSGPVTGGLASECDPSGTGPLARCCEEVYPVIPVHSDPAAIMTHHHIVDATYTEEPGAELVERVG